MQDASRLADQLHQFAASGRRPDDEVGVLGVVHYVLLDPRGCTLAEGEVSNLVTEVGERMYAERGAGIGSLAAPTGMQLGTGSTAPAKTGAGAAIVTFVTGSYSALSPAAAYSLVATKARITYVSSWAAGVATATGIQEVVLVNASTTTVQSAPTTIARALLSPVVNKGTDDTLAVTWTHDIGS